MEEQVNCSGCERLVKLGDISAAMNLPYVTDGPVYWCRVCQPPINDSETIIAQIELFMNPIAELGEEECN